VEMRVLKLVRQKTRLIEVHSTYPECTFFGRQLTRKLSSSQAFTAMSSGATGITTIYPYICSRGVMNLKKFLVLQVGPTFNPSYPHISSTTLQNTTMMKTIWIEAFTIRDAIYLQAHYHEVSSKFR
jgi:hypothetical protein